MVKIYRNGTQLTNFILLAPYSDTIDDELDKANFQIKSTSRLTFTKNDKITYIVSQNISNVETNVIQKTFCLFDYVETLDGEYWLYQLTCLSPTKLLENIIVNGMAETHSNWTLKQQLERTILKINKQFVCESTYPIELKLTTSGTSDLYILNTKQGSDFLWSGQQTAREILQDICDKADMLLVATDFIVYANAQFNIKEITLDAIPREKSGTKLIETNSSIEGGGLDAYKTIIKGLSIHRNSEFTNGSIISLMKNGICKDNVQQTYLPARNDDLTIDDEADWHILTQEPIYSLNKVYAYISVRTYVKVWRDNGGVLEEQFYSSTGQPNSNPTPLFMLMPYDITDYIVEKDVFDALPTKEQKKRLYFKRGERGIYGLYKRYKENPLWSNKALDNICKSMTPSIVVNDNGVLTLDYCGNPPMLMDLGGNLRNVNNDFPSAYSYPFHYSESGLKEADSVKTFDRTGLTLDDIEVEHALFSVNYQPYCDSVVKIGKGESINARSYNLSVLKNQSDRTIDASKYYDSQRALIKRLGNDEMSLDCMFDGVRLWSLGDFMLIQSDKWTLTKREIENYGNDKIKARLTFSNKYNASNSAINVNRDKRLYGIPLNNYVDRYLLINVDTAYDYTKLLVYSYDDFTLNQDESTTDTQIGYTILDLIRIGNDEIIDKVARCKDNYAVDIERTKYSSTIVNVNLRYCMTNGEMEDIHLKLLTDSQYNQLTISDYSRLPFLPTTTINVGIDKTLDDIYKDKMERLIFVIKGYNPN